MTLFDTLAVSASSEILTVDKPSRMWIAMAGTWGGGTVAVHSSKAGETFAAWTANGTAVSYDADDDRLFEVPEGRFQFVAASVTEVNIYVRVEAL
jgi:hypothetical protein